MHTIPWNIEWTEEMRTGYTEIDNDHLTLINLINQFNLSVVDRKPINEVKKNTDKMIKFFDQHCDREEKLLEKYNYPEASYHAQEHDELKELVTLIMQSVRPDANDFKVIDAGLKAKQEKIKHILHADIKFIKHFRDQQNSNAAK